MDQEPARFRGRCDPEDRRRTVQDRLVSNPITYLPASSWSRRNGDSLLEHGFRAAALGNIAGEHDHQWPCTRIGIRDRQDSSSEFFHFSLGLFHQIPFGPIERGGDVPTSQPFLVQRIQLLSDPKDGYTDIPGPACLPRFRVHRVQLLLKVSAQRYQVRRHDRRSRPFTLIPFSFLPPRAVQALYPTATRQNLPCYGFIRGGLSDDPRTPGVQESPLRKKNPVPHFWGSLSSDPPIYGTRESVSRCHILALRIHN